MKTIKQIKCLESFINGVISSTELGDTIDERKELKFIVTEIPCAWSIKAVWIKAITYAKSESDPRLQRDNIYHFEDYYFSVLTSNSPRKLASEIVDCLDYVNTNKLNED